MTNIKHAFLIFSLILLTGCVTLSPGEKLDATLASYTVNEDKVYKTASVEVYELVTNDKNAHASTGIILQRAGANAHIPGQASAQIMIMPDNIRFMRQDLEMKLKQDKPSTVNVFDTSGISLGYQAHVSFVNGQRLVSIRNASLHFTFDVKGTQELINVLQKVENKNLGG